MTNTFSISQKKIGVIGYGNFGKIICSNLFPENNILLFSKHAKEAQLDKHIRLAKSIEELVKESEIIIPAVPIREFENVIKIIAPFLNPDSLVMDVCSVKQYPVEIMKKYLAEKAMIIATHPMFGPNSLKMKKNNLQGLKIFMYNVNAYKNIYADLKKHFINLGINVIEINLPEHDKLSANSQFFALIIGELAQKLSIKPTPIDTPGAQSIYEALKYMGSDRIIIEDMLKYNSYCEKILNEIILDLKTLKQNL